jgi:hypothetical protein
MQCVMGMEAADPILKIKTAAVIAGQLFCSCGLVLPHYPQRPILVEVGRECRQATGADYVRARMIRSLILVSVLLATPASAGNQHDWDCPGGAKLHVGVMKKFDEKKQEDEPRCYLSIDAARNFPLLAWKQDRPYLNGKPCKAIQ